MSDQKIIRRKRFCQIVKEIHKGSVKNNLVEFAPEFAVDLINLIEQNRKNSELFRGLLRLKIG